MDKTTRRRAIKSTGGALLGAFVAVSAVTPAAPIGLIIAGVVGASAGAVTGAVEPLREARIALRRELRRGR